MPAYISEFFHEGGPATDFVEIAVPAGTDTSAYTLVHYNSDGTVNATYAFGTAVGTMGGHNVYLLDASTPLADIKSNEAIALVDDTGTVLQFLTSEGSNVLATTGPANGMTSQNVGSTSGGLSHQTDDDGASYYAESSPNPGTIPCYAPGTLIDTPDGPRAVETLRVGDLVETLDHGALPIRWTRQGEQTLDRIGYDGKPVLVREGAFGPGRPARDLIVSPQHRILVGGAGQLDGLFDGQCFATAKALTDLPRIRAMMGRRAMTWVHFAFDTHEVVTANGCFSESLLLGPMVLNGLTALQRRALDGFLGQAGPNAALNGPAARDCLTVGMVRRVLQQLTVTASAAA